MDTRRILLALAVGLLGLSSAGAALASTELGGMRAENYRSILDWTARPNTFYLQNSDSRQVFDFKKARRLRICDEVRAQSVDLTVKHAGRKTDVKPGQCDAVDAKHVAVQAAGRLPAGVSLTGTVETVEPAHKSG